MGSVLFLGCGLALQGGEERVKIRVDGEQRITTACTAYAAQLLLLCSRSRCRALDCECNGKNTEA